MAKDDYHIIAYRILVYLYACVKSGIVPDMEQINFEKFKIKEAYWNFIISELLDNGYITGVQKIRFAGTAYDDIKIIQLRITAAGIEYISENSMMHKAKEFLKGIAEIVPGLIP